jgi:ribosome-associated protein
MIEIAKGVHINEEDLVFQASRSSGPGGQNVNKVSSRITVLFDVEACSDLTPQQKALILRRLKNRSTAGGVIRVTSQESRSQTTNRQAAVTRLAELLTAALIQRPPRKATKVPYNARLKRLQNKTRRSQLKKLRTSGSFGE